MEPKIDTDEFKRKPQAAREDFPEPEMPEAEAAPQEKITIPSEFPNPDAVTAPRMLRENFDKVMRGQVGLVTVTEEEKALFLKALLADVPVTFELQGFGGTIKARFRSRSPKETDEIFKQLKQDIAAGRVELDTIYQQTLQLYALTVQMISFSGEALADYKSFQPSDADVKAGKGNIYLAAARFRDAQNELRVSAQIFLLAEFEKKVGHMSGMLLNSDFWKPAGTS